MLALSMPLESAPVITAIIYYDGSTLPYMSAFVGGLKQLSVDIGFKFCVSRALPDFMKEAQFEISRTFIEKAGFDDSQGIALNCTGLFQAYLRDGSSFFFCIDASDHAEFSKTADGVYYGYHIPLLEKSGLYFKVNFNKNALATAPALGTLAERIRPLPVVYPAPITDYWNYLPARLPMSLISRRRGFAVQRMKDIFNLVSMGKLSRFRSAQKSLDTFFVVNYYDKAQDNEFRLELIARLREASGLNAIAGFASHHPLPAPYERYRVSRYRIADYMAMLSKSRVSIYCRGVHDCLSFKLGSYLEMGLPIVGQRLCNNQAFYSTHGPIWGQFAYDDPHDIVASVREAVREPTRLRDLARANAEFFDQHLSPASLAGRVVETLIARGCNFPAPDTNLSTFH